MKPIFLNACPHIHSIKLVECLPRVGQSVKTERRAVVPVYQQDSESKGCSDMVDAAIAFQRHTEPELALYGLSGLQTHGGVCGFSHFWIIFFILSLRSVCMDTKYSDYLHPWMTPQPIPLPTSCPLPFLKENKPWSPISAAHLCITMGLPSGTWATHQWPPCQRKMTPPVPAAINC